jgi:hypothetical protein
MSRKRSAIFPESFATIRITDLYRHGVVGPKPDRLRLTSSPSGVLVQRMEISGQSFELRAEIADGRLHVSGDLLGQDAVIELSEIHICKGRYRVAFVCPGCETKVFHISCPIVERRPDGSGLRRELLCRHCHRITRSSWRYGGHQKIERACLQRRVMVEKLGSNPTVKGRGVATVRHDKWFARFLKAERLLLEPHNMSSIMMTNTPLIPWRIPHYWGG